MKTIVMVIIITMITSAAIFGQKSGKIEYMQTIYVHKNLTEDQKVYKALLPETVESKILFLFHGDKARLKTVKDDSNKGLQTQMTGGSTNTVINYTENKILNLQDYDNRTYYVEKPAETMENIEFVNETKNILGYSCQKAVTTSDSGDKMFFWFAKDLKVKATPMIPVIGEYAILEIEKEKISYKALNIDFSSIDNVEFQVPEGAKKITKEQLKDLQDEKSSEMNVIKSK